MHALAAGTASYVLFLPIYLRCPDSLAFGGLLPTYPWYLILVLRVLPRVPPSFSAMARRPRTRAAERARGAVGGVEPLVGRMKGGSPMKKNAFVFFFALQLPSCLTPLPP